MRVLGLVAIILPQLLLLMLFGGYFDLLGGWNHTESGFHTLLLLFSVTPPVACIWLMALAVSNLRGRSHGRPRQPLWPAMVVLVQALALDLLILSQAHM